MPKVKFEEDDTIAFISKTKGLRIGLINKVYSDDSSSDEDDLDDKDESSDEKSLKPDQVRIEWYPTGRESVLGCENVKLIDRTLLMGEVVRPVDEINKIGFISNVSVSCDVALLPEAQFVLKNVQDSRVDFIEKYCDSNSEPKYVLYENWVGSVNEVAETLTLKSTRGYRCTILTSADNFDLIDASFNRVENSAFDDQQWYVGQVVKCSFECLRKAVWLSEPKSPPEHFIRRVSADGNSNLKAKFIIEKVEMESFNIHWISPVVGLEGRIDPPNSLILGQDIQKLILVNRFEHQFVQIGDRINVEILPSDTLVHIDQWRAELFDEIMKKNLHYANSCTKNAGDICATDSLENFETASSIDSGNCASNFTELAENEFTVTGAIASTAVLNDERSEEWSDCDSEASEKTDKAVSVTSKSRQRSHSFCKYSFPRASNNNNVTLKWLKKLKSPLKVSRPPSKKAKTSSNADVRQLSNSNLATNVKPFYEVGQRCSAEAVFVRTYADVIWQDGSKTAKIPTSRLSYAEIELDEHLFFPGSFVLLQEEKGKLWPPNGYGVVTRVDVANRLADVSWYEVTPSSGGAVVGLPKLLKTDQASVYDLISNSDYHYSSGSLVMRIENLKLINEIYVGQVLYTTSDGMLCVQWLSGECENVYPQELCKLVNDDGNWSDHSDNLSDEDGSDAGSDDSWSTVEESDHNNEDSDDSVVEEAEADAAGNNSSKTTDKKSSPVEAIVPEVKGFSSRIRDSIMGLLKSSNSSESSTPKVSPVAEINKVVNDDRSCSSSSQEFVMTTVNSSLSQEFQTADSEIATEIASAPFSESANSNGFDISEEPPTCHVYINETFDATFATPKFTRAVRQEHKILRTSLAPNIFVKTYENRMDLFSVMIRGAAGTPYVNGLFIFDVRLTPTYPHDPPTVFYRSFSSEQLNPNLYQDGKVCVSLLGTWSGKDSEVWNPGSNLMQVLVSIQGLILNAEPYFNEAGYESRRALAESFEKSRCYNEMALIRSLENLVSIVNDPPPPFEKEILDHLRCRGAGLVQEVGSWLDNTLQCNFPLQPISLGCSLSAKKQLKKLEQILAQKFG